MFIFEKWVVVGYETAALLNDRAFTWSCENFGFIRYFNNKLVYVCNPVKFQFLGMESNPWTEEHVKNPQDTAEYFAAEIKKQIELHELNNIEMTDTDEWLAARDEYLRNKTLLPTT